MTSTRYKTAMAFLEGFRDYDPEMLVRDRTPDCQQIMAPASLGFPEPWSNQRVFDFYTEMRKEVLQQCHLTVKEVIEDAKNNKIVMWLTSHATFHQVGDGGGEYMFLLEFTDDGKKVKRFVEFVDCVKAFDIKAKIEESVAVVAKKKAASEL